MKPSCPRKLPALAISGDAYTSMSPASAASIRSMSPALKASMPACARLSRASLLAIAIHLEHREERLLWNLDRAHLLHPLLALLLLLEELLLPADVAAVELRRHVLADGLDGLTGDHVGADRRLDGNVELLPRDRLAQALHQVAPLVVGGLLVHDQGKGVHLVAGEQHVELHQIRWPVLDRLVVQRRIALAPRLELVEEVEHDLGQWQVVLNLYACRREVVDADVLPPPL